MTSFSYLFGSGSPRVKIPSELTDLGKLRAHLKVSKRELRKISLARATMYHEFSLYPSGKKVRTISAPDRRLNFLQGMLRQLLGELYQPRNSSHGFIRERSILTNAAPHAGKRHILSLDLKDFFPSISEQRVLGLLHNLGLPSDVAEAVSSICCVNGALPQGAPSSPVLSNMICFKLDKELHSFAKDNKLIYTRYADDISLSTNGSPTCLFSEAIPPSGKIEAQRLSEALLSCIHRGGFKLNEEKIHYAAGSSRKIVTGLVVNEFPNLSREFIRNVRATIYNIEKHGYATAQARYARYRPRGKLENHLRGELNHLGTVRGKGDPTYRNLADRFNVLFKSPVRTERTPKERLERAIWVVEWKFTDDRIDALYADAKKVGKPITEVEESFQGTAFFLEDIGLVTAEHCIPRDVTDIEYFEVWHPSEPLTKFPVKVQKKCATRDIAILENTVPGNLYENLKRYRVRARGGDTARAYGFTDYRIGDSVTSSAGEISHINVRSGVRLLNLSFKVGQGMSGGPVVDVNSGVIGVVHKGGPDALRDYAVVLDEVLALSLE